MLDSSWVSCYNLLMLSTQNLSPEVHFEEGMHSKNRQEQASLMERVIRGEPNANEWNWSVSERISSYKPGLIAIDGLWPYYYEDGDISLDAKKFIWASLPDRPSRLNGTDEIVVLGGDCLYGSDGKMSSGPTPQRAIVAGSIVASGIYAGTEIDQLLESKQRRAQESEIDMAIAEIDPIRLKHALDTQIDRRRFFTLAGALTASAVVFSPQILTYSPWTTSQRMLRAINDTQKDVENLLPFSDTDTILVGRTALLIEKTYEVLKSGIDIGTSSVGSVVMGNGHTYRAQEFLDNPDARSQSIEDLTRKIVEFALADDKFFESYDNTGDTNMRIRYVRDQLAKIQLYKVKEPDDDLFVKDPFAEIDRCVSLIGEYQSPRIDEVTAGLGIQ